MRFQLNSPHVVEEKIDDEVMVIHLVSGVYYNMVSPAADIWQSIINGVSLPSLTTYYVRHFPDCEKSIIADLASFVAALESEQLIVSTAPNGNTMENENLLPPHAPNAWKAPELNRYTDMQEMLLVDPIHEVTAEGWPQKTKSDSRDR
ncbi:MAG: hypothetical protein P8N76_16675 [Pirellulaceae bacterium]|nr:hypothetical protein [Pirellulaceae bacterium]